MFAASDIYYFVRWGAAFGLQALLLLGCSLITTFVCEAIFAKVKKENIKDFITHSFGWVTSLILVMMWPDHHPALCGNYRDDLCDRIWLVWCSADLDLTFSTRLL